MRDRGFEVDPVLVVHAPRTAAPFSASSLSNEGKSERDHSLLDLRSFLLLSLVPAPERYDLLPHRRRLERLRQGSSSIPGRPVARRMPTRGHSLSCQRLRELADGTGATIHGELLRLIPSEGPDEGTQLVECQKRPTGFGNRRQLRGELPALPA